MVEHYREASLAMCTMPVKDWYETFTEDNDEQHAWATDDVFAGTVHALVEYTFELLEKHGVQF